MPTPSGTPVDIVDTDIATYSANVTGLNPASSATDVFIIIGSATKTIKIRRIRISGSATSASIGDFVLVKRSTANTGGTSTSPAMVPHDSADGAATATVKSYTANPTLGTLVGAIRSIKTAVPSATTPAFTAAESQFVFGDQAKPIVLRGTNEMVGVNLNGISLTGGSLDICIEWSEE